MKPEIVSQKVAKHNLKVAKHNLKLVNAEIEKRKIIKLTPKQVYEHLGITTLRSVILTIIIALVCLFVFNMLYIYVFELLIIGYILFEIERHRKNYMIYKTYNNVEMKTTEEHLKEYRG